VEVLKPKQKDEELHRKEIVCNTLLIFVLILMTILSVLVLKNFFYMGSNYAGISPLIMLSITGSVICLLCLSRIGYVSQVSHVMILILIAGCVYGQVIWGADLPSVILLWAFIITASSILISTRYSLDLSPFKTHNKDFSSPPSF
jgi:drug/metabolite transporter (DMT)-like permease